MVDVLPPNNLPGESRRWGRDVDDWLYVTERDINNFSDRIENNTRVESGKLGQISEMSQTLAAQATEVFRVPDLTLSGGAATPPYPTGLRPFLVSGSVRPRIVNVSVSATVTQTVGQRLLFFYGVNNDGVFLGGVLDVGLGTTALTGFGSFLASPSDQLWMQLVFVSTPFSVAAQNSTFNIEDITISVSTSPERR